MKLYDIVKTCSAQPSQWEAKTFDKRKVYIRVEGYFFELHVGDFEHGKNLISFSHCFENNYFWEMTTENMLKIVDTLPELPIIKFLD